MQCLLKYCSENETELMTINAARLGLT